MTQSNTLLFKKVTWKNFLKTGNAPLEMDLENKKSILFIGENGAGKSQMVDALCFGLFGKPFRIIKKGQLINSINQKNTEITIDFSVYGNEYKIIRGIKPDKFQIYKNGTMINQNASVKEQQKVLEEQILGMSFAPFIQVVVLGNANFKPFMVLSAEERRKVVEDILSISIFTKMNKVIKEEKSNNAKLLDEKTHELSKKRQEAEYQKKILDNLNETVQSNTQKIREKIEDNNRQINDYNEKITELGEEFKEVKTGYTPLDEIKNKISKVTYSISGLATEIRKIQSEIDFLEGNENCPTCKQELHKDTKEEKIITWKQEIEKKEAERKSYQNEKDSLEVEFSRNQKIKGNMDEIKSKANNCKSSIQHLEGSNAKLLKEEADILKIDDGKINVEREKFDVIISEGKELNEEKKELDEKCLIDNACYNMLKDSGVKTKIVQQYLSTINSLINKFLADLGLYAQFELDENFNETIKSRDRDSFSYNNFSEGEKMRINLAILLSWRYISKMKNSVNTNILILDEVFDSSLDEEGSNEFLGLLQSLNKEVNTFVISHRNVNTDCFDNIVQFSKKNEFSHMEFIKD